MSQNLCRVSATAVHTWERLPLTQSVRGATVGQEEDVLSSCSWSMMVQFTKKVKLGLGINRRPVGIFLIPIFLLPSRFQTRAFLPFISGISATTDKGRRELFTSRTTGTASAWTGSGDVSRRLEGFGGLVEEMRKGLRPKDRWVR